MFERRFIWIWLLSLSTAFFLLVLPLLLPTTYYRAPSFVLFIERHYLGFKQSLISSFESESQHKSEIALYRIAVSSRAKFWQDKNLKQKVADQLSQHKGLIFSGLDPELLLADPMLNPLLKNKNFIRDFRFERDSKDDLSIQSQLAETIHDSVPEKYSQFLSLRPDDHRYYSKDYFFGSSNLVKDLFSHFIFEYPLTVRGAETHLPTMLATFAILTKRCESFTRTTHGALQCDGTGEIWPDPLPLQFSGPSPAIYSPDRFLSPANATLIVEIYDGATLYSTFNKADASWGQILATALSNISSEKNYIRPLSLPWIEALIGLFFALFVAFFAHKLKLRDLIPAVLVLSFVYFALDFAATAYGPYFTHPMNGMITFAGISLLCLSYRAIRDFSERRTLEAALSGYLSQSRLSRLLAGTESLRLEGRRAELCILILDVVGFSKISESLSPEATFAFLRDLFSVIDPIIFEHHGFIDKKMGDGLIAVFGDDPGVTQSPSDICAAALSAALRIQKVQKVALRIGVNHGPVVIGNSGSAQHFNYTTIGEVVNFTQRLEAGCPSGSILVSAEVYSLTKERFRFRPLQIQVKGRTEPVEAFEVLSAH